MLVTRPDPATVWRNRDFRKLFGAQAISELGSRITREGLPLTAILALQATPSQMGFLAAAGAIPVLVFSLGAGVWVDRVRRRPLMIWADLGRALVLGTVPLCAALGVLRLEHLFAITLAAGALTVLFDVAYQSYLPSLVEPEQVLAGNSKLAMSSSIAEIAGPAVTGFLVKALTAPIAILVDAVSFLASALLVGLIRKSEPLPAPRQEQNLATEALAGLREISHSPVLRALALRASTLFFFLGLVGPLYLLYAIRELQFSTVVLGLVIAVGGIGNLCGAHFSARVSNRFGMRAALLGSAIVLALALSLITLPSGPGAFAIAAFMAQQFLGDSAFVVYMVNEVSLRQIITPEALLGRVNASMQLLTRGIYPLGAFASGMMAEAIGLRATMVVGAGGILLSVLWLLPVRDWSKKRMSLNDPDTTSFYDTHASQFKADTAGSDMQPLYDRFLPLLPEKAHILDAGCGPGRDSLAFAQQGYSVVAIDASAEMVLRATELTGQPALKMRFDELNFNEEFDGIWACAALLHIPRSEISAIFEKLTRGLKRGGILYASFKQGKSEELRNGRWYNDYDEAGLLNLIESHPNLEVIDIWTTPDVRTGRKQELWLNALLRRTS